MNSYSYVGCCVCVAFFGECALGASAACAASVDACAASAGGGGCISASALPPVSAPDTVVPLADLFRLLGDPTRLRIVLACVDGKRAVGAIAEALGLVGVAREPSFAVVARGADRARRATGQAGALSRGGSPHQRDAGELREHVAEPQTDFRPDNDHDHAYARMPMSKGTPSTTDHDHSHGHDHGHGGGHQHHHHHGRRRKARAARSRSRSG